ncbi:MAG: hypothetical protein ABS904_00030 [Solibacillus isronensis]
MYLFYDEISGSHNVTDEWIVNSASYVLYSNIGERLAEQHVTNSFIWGGPSLIYTTVNSMAEPVTHADWLTPIQQATTAMLTKAVEHIEQNPTDNELTLITWNGYDYLDDSLSDFTHKRVAHELDKKYVKLYSAATSMGISLQSFKPQDRIEAIIQLYFSSIKKIT